MEWNLGKWVLLWVIVLLQIHQHRCCFEDERMSLLGFKASLESYDLLPSWVDEKESADCCRWERVTCNTTSSHVIHLSLANLQKLDYYYDEMRRNWPFNRPNWLLNLSFFFRFKELQSLDLSFNSFGGLVENEGFERLSDLRKLEFLDLSYNFFSNISIIQSLGALTSLKTLILSDNLFDGYFPINELVAFRNLQKLDLQGNDFQGFLLPVQDFGRLSILKKLETLILDHNEFNNSILPYLSELTSLKILSLFGNYLEGSFPAQELATLENLEMLDVGANQLNGTLTTQDSKSLSKLSNLKHLDLSFNGFNKEILKILGSLPALKSLHLEYNEMEGSLSNQGLCELKKLEELDLSWNSFDGILPSHLRNLTSLRMLDLSKNNFRGSISSSLISALKSLEHIDLSHNRFNGSFSFSSFANHTKLEVVQFINDNEEFEVETEFSDWVPMFQLKVLVLRNCNLNKLTGDIPNFLLNQSELSAVDLSNNHLKGRFPNWLLENSTRLEFLNLRNNSFTGQLYLPLYPNINTGWMDVSDNQIGGQLPKNIGGRIPHITHLNLSRNAFEGAIPTSICDMGDLHTLDFSNNRLSGKVPKQLIAGCIDLLRVLKLSNNNFHGKIFSEHFNLTRIEELFLDNNHFIGTLSNVISGSSLLKMLDIGNNYMSSEIQGGIDNMRGLSTLIMRNNSFKGLFPCELMPSSFLDLSHNHFSGFVPCCSNSEYVPHCSNLQYPEHIHLRDNKFTGSIPKVFLNSSTLLTLDIRDNFLCGNISDSIGGLSNLRVLLLRGNLLSGLIPYQLCQLKKIGLMDLSHNSFSGSIPHCFNNITFWKTGISEHVFTPKNTSWSTKYTIYRNVSDLLNSEFTMSDTDENHDEQDEVEFVTKYISLTYKGDILNYMSGLDLSCNKLTGEIPHNLGKLSLIHALNLSHNQLTGSIPSAFSNLNQIESIDLSYNNLSGEIPSELIDLHFLEVFSVAHNNLSGRVPDMKGQFGTFEKSSYDGNPFLCGPQLEKNCTTFAESPQSSTFSSDESKRKRYEIDLVAFYASFGASYAVFLLGVVSVLYINLYWRRWWFNLIEECFYSCCYFIYDTFYKFSSIFS